MLLKSYPQKQLFKMSVPKFCGKAFKKHHWKWPYWIAAQKSTAQTVVQIVCAEILAEIAFEKLSLKII